MATTLIMLGRAWLWGGAALTLLAYGYVWWTEGFWQMEKSGIFSFSNGLEVLPRSGAGYPPIDPRETPPSQA